MVSGRIAAARAFREQWRVHPIAAAAKSQQP
jgi:hypothetical protein